MHALRDVGSMISEKNMTTGAPFAATYLSVIFAGVPIVMAYNFLASALLSFKDGKTPLLEMAACVFLSGT